MTLLENVTRIKTQSWLVMTVVMMVTLVQVATLNGPNVCMVKQKYNITKRVKYRAPMSVRTYEWCFSMPPRCSKWNTEMRDLTRLETEERTAEVAVCCPGYKMKDVSCVPICPNGRTGSGCSDACPTNRWGPNCVNECQPCHHGTCSPLTGDCNCEDGWKGESCDTSMPATSSTTTVEELLTTKATKTTVASTTPTTTTITTPRTTISTFANTAAYITSSTSTPTIPSTTTFTTPSTTMPTTPSITTSTSPSTTTITTPVTTNTTPSTTTSSTPSTIMTTTPVITTEEIVTSPSTTSQAITSPVSSQVTAATTATTTKSIITTSNVPTTEPTNKATETTESLIISDTTLSTIAYNMTLTSLSTTKATLITIPATTTSITTIQGTTEAIYNRTEIPNEVTKALEAIFIKETLPTAANTPKIVTTSTMTTTETPKPTIPIVTETIVKETTKKLPDSTVRYFPSTIKFKPKEIWIRPAQKGESFVESKIKPAHEHSRYRSPTNKEFVPNTTPKTIIVSIIPTSVSYTTFKKIALSTTSNQSQKFNMMKSHNKSTEDVTKPMSVHTSTPSLTTPSSFTSKIATDLTTIIFKSSFAHNATRPLSSPPALATTARTKASNSNGTNSMRSIVKVLISKPTSSNILTTIPSTNVRTTQKHTVADESVTMLSLSTASTKVSDSVHVPKYKLAQYVTSKPKFKTFTDVWLPTKKAAFSKNNKSATEKIETTKTPVKLEKTVNWKETNTTKIATTNNVTTEKPEDEDTFHILTEPEHITAVMGDKGSERSSVDLISVISIAGGIMMAVITVAVVIVMIERCKKPRYEDVRKINDIRMQVMMDNNDVPPPYVRSIFHTPLPEPPTSEKCHYQPISTLDRNLKQFMRPVVVQPISPIMLEKFRDILECHYDHLPRRSHDFGPIQPRSSVAPSMSDCSELRTLRASLTESTIEALKCEAKLDVIDNTTSEPLYAEIPCWRPPSEHAVEIMNLNGEAVTEL